MVDITHLLTVDVDGKVSVNHLHLVLIPMCDTSDHVGNVAANSANSGELLLGAEPLLNLQSMCVSRLQ
jgi:hypothetical protein